MCREARERSVLALCAALLIVPSAFAKGRITVRLGDGKPRVGQKFTVYVRTGYVVPAEDWLRLIAVAPATTGTTWWGSSPAIRNWPGRAFRAMASGSLSCVQDGSPGALP